MTFVQRLESWGKSEPPQTLVETPKLLKFQSGEVETNVKSSDEEAKEEIEYLRRFCDELQEGIQGIHV